MVVSVVMTAGVTGKPGTPSTATVTERWVCGVRGLTSVKEKLS